MKLGRNDPCSCGSGKKYKNCCLGKEGFRLPCSSAPTPDELNLLDAMFNSGRYEELESRARSLLHLYSDSGVVWKLLGLSLQMQGKDALSVMQKAAELLPNDAEAHGNLAAVLQVRGQLEAAVTSGRRALQIRPDFAEAHNNLGSALKKLGQLDAAVVSYRRALQLKPDFAEAHNNLGNALKELGQNDEALASYRRALEIKPDFAEVQTNLLFTLNYADHPSENCLEEARKYGRMVDKKVASRFSSWQCADQPERLRVGIVSGDMHNNPVGYFLETLLVQLDPARIELIAYPTDMQVDALTTRIKPCFTAWKPLLGLSDATAARQIHADGVHVLLDLSGHTPNNRLPVFAWKPAPVQATWLGYIATTGVAEMDYILGDKWMLPDGEEHHFVEKGWRLPGAHSCLSPPKEDIKIEELPALRNQSITFGTLNRSAKMNARVVACWAQILNEIPNSRLYLNMSNLRDEALRKIVIDRYAAHGIAADRLILEATIGRVAALNSYNRIDIALDPFPYPGGTTSYEALWMGVPILTMRGSNYISHLGESIMHNAGLPDWIAANEEDYIAKVVAYSADLADLAKLRSSLRARVLASPLFDAPRFARDFEDALWGMWYARTRHSPTPPELLTVSHD